MKVTFFTQLTIAAMCARQSYAQVTADSYLDFAQNYSDSLFAEDGTSADMIGYGQIEGEGTEDEGELETKLAESESEASNDDQVDNMSQSDSDLEDDKEKIVVDSFGSSGSESDHESMLGDTLNLAELSDDDFDFDMILAQVQSQILAIEEPLEPKEGNFFAQIAAYLSDFAKNDLEKLGKYLSQSDAKEASVAAPEVQDMLAQTESQDLGDEKLAFVASSLAQMGPADMAKVAFYYAQNMGLSQTDASQVLSQVGIEAQPQEEGDDMIPRVASFMAQLGDQQLGQIEQYLAQKMVSRQTGQTFAQVTIDENLAAIADYLVTMDDTELAQMNSMISTQRQ